MFRSESVWLRFLVVVWGIFIYSSIGMAGAIAPSATRVSPSQMSNNLSSCIADDWAVSQKFVGHEGDAHHASLMAAQTLCSGQENVPAARRGGESATVSALISEFTCQEEAPCKNDGREVTDEMNPNDLFHKHLIVRPPGDESHPDRIPLARNPEILVFSDDWHTNLAAATTSGKRVFPPTGKRQLPGHTSKTNWDEALNLGLLLLLLEKYLTRMV